MALSRSVARDAAEGATVCDSRNTEILRPWRAIAQVDFDFGRAYPQRTLRGVGSRKFQQGQRMQITICKVPTAAPAAISGGGDRSRFMAREENAR